MRAGVPAASAARRTSSTSPSCTGATSCVSGPWTAATNRLTSAASTAPLSTLARRAALPTA